jgi:hypothetical protein
MKREAYQLKTASKEAGRRGRARRSARRKEGDLDLDPEPEPEPDLDPEPEPEPDPDPEPDLDPDPALLTASPLRSSPSTHPARSASGHA